jgi:hypothetical protein
LSARALINGAVDGWTPAVMSRNQSMVARKPSRTSTRGSQPSWVRAMVMSG